MKHVQLGPDEPKTTSPVKWPVCTVNIFSNNYLLNWIRITRQVELNKQTGMTWLACLSFKVFLPVTSEFFILIIPSFFFGGVLLPFMSSFASAQSFHVMWHISRLSSRQLFSSGNVFFCVCVHFWVCNSNPIKRITLRREKHLSQVPAVFLVCSSPLCHQSGLPWVTLEPVAWWNLSTMQGPTCLNFWWRAGGRGWRR